MERIYTFLPSVITIACIAAVTFLYLKLVAKRYGDNFKSIAWHQKNRWKVIWTVGTPLQYVLAPTAEELVFRAPIIIAFGTLSTHAWYAIYASAALFAFTHWFGKKVKFDSLIEAKEGGELESDDGPTELTKLSEQRGKTTLVSKALHVVLTFPLGLAAGYYGIKYQSLWVAVGIHAAWNIFMPVIITLLALVVQIVATIGIVVFYNIREDVRWRRRKRCRT